MKRKESKRFSIELTYNEIQEIQEVLDGATNFSMSFPGAGSKVTDRASELALTFQNAVESAEEAADGTKRRKR